MLALFKIQSFNLDSLLQNTAKVTLIIPIIYATE